MIRSARVLFVILIVTLIVPSLFGCSRLFQPSDTDIVNAIQNSDVFKSGIITLKSPVTIVEKMGRGKDGAWPVRVKATVSYKANRDLSFKSDRRKNAEPIEVTEEKTLFFKLHKTVDKAGNAEWKADLAG